MCLISEYNTPLKAKNELVCYKIYMKWFMKLVSPYMRCLIPEVGIIVSTELESPSSIERNMRGNFLIKTGFHSFEHLEDAQEFAKNIDRPVIYRCIIPKDSEYYKGLFWEYNSYCSKNIKLVKQV